MTEPRRALRGSHALAFVALVVVCTQAWVSADAAAPPNRPPAPELRVYAVRPGDTLSQIAERFRVTGGALRLAALNDMSDPGRLRQARLLVPASPPWTDRLARLHRSVSSAPPLRACTLAAAPRPEVTQLEGCFRAACASLTDGRRVCSCIAPEDERWDHELRVLDARGRVRWRRRAWFSMGGEEAFDVRRGDVDGDGRPELVIATLTAVGNGLGVTTWELGISRDDGSGLGRAIVEEYGDDTLVARGHGRGCDVLLTRWAEAEDPRRGVGTYLVGRRGRWRPGRIHGSGGPLRARRLLHSFAEERDRSCEGSAGTPACARPARWLSDPRAVWLSRALRR